MSLTEQQLTEIWNAILDDKIDIKLWIYFYDLKSQKEYKIIWGSYNGKELYFERRSDWGVILNSIEIGEEIHDVEC